MSTNGASSTKAEPSLKGYFAYLFDGSGPSSGPTYAEIESVWQRIVAQDDGSDEVPRDYLKSLAVPETELVQSPIPHLLDYMKVKEDLTDHNQISSAIQSPSMAQSSQIAQSSSQSTRHFAKPGYALHDRIKMHLPASSTFSALIGLISTKRSNEDIQSELVEILGFEGNGLSLVEELLQPGARDRVVEECGLMNNKKVQANTQSVSAGARYLPSSRLNVNATKGKQKKQAIDLSEMIGSAEDIARRIHEQLDKPKALFHEDGPRIAEQEILPNVYTTSSATSGMSMGGKLAMPAGTSREIFETHEEVIIPPVMAVPPRITERPVRIHDLPPMAKGCFPKYVTLNRMQSIVQPTAMNTNENLLICAPTGAGKTDVAIMAVIRVLSQYTREGPTSHPSGFSIDRDAFKVIYVAPMKALAAEITRKFGKRLAWLGIKVRELTGDMQLTKQEISETQIIVTTPEKWDVVTRKPTGEGELASKVKLLIIDEVHLLNEERGAVIETIVARTLRQVESSQSLIRIVGLSATLPNYIDVSDFLRVNRHQGLFFFDASFRPVPLEQHFLGIAGKARSQRQAQNMDKVVFDKVAELVQEGHQVMVFVHARKETVKTATTLKEMALDEGMATFFQGDEHPKYGQYRRDIATSRNKEMKELFDAGFGIHHAGMLRSDRNMMERMFEDQAIKVLCCTSTLAWGVNLPAHAVIIKGTQVYDSSKGAFMDLSILDVLQIFGRAGRPGYETSGVGYICTAHDKLDHYLYSIMSQHAIESKFTAGMVDSLNAEIALGTITNVQEGIQWLGYTYLFVRMRKEPLIYGMSHEEPRDDPQLGNQRNKLIIQAARQLSTAKMIRYDEVHNVFVVSDLGRIAAKYYLKYQTIEIFNELFHPKMKNADMFAMLSQSTEFDQIQVRDNEIEELTAILQSDHCPMEVKGGVTNKHGKVNILLQAHISKVFLEDFALVSDSAYVAQNAARIIRALLEIALSRNWANNAILLIDLSKAIEKRLWPYEHPLSQITTLHRDTMFNLKKWQDDTEVGELRVMDPKELGEKIHLNEKHGTAVRDAALMFPSVSVEYALKPLSHELLQLSVKVTPEFNWNSKISSTAEPFYIWVQEESGVNILQWRSVLIRQTTSTIDIDFLIPSGDNPPESVTIISASDRWLGSDTSTLVSLTDLVVPQPPPDSTELLDIPFLHISALDDALLQKSYSRSFTSLNSFQSQVFWPAYHTQANLLLSAPVGSGKSFIGEMSIWHSFRHNPEGSVMVMVPNLGAVQETAEKLRYLSPRQKGIEVVTMLRPADFNLALGRTGQIVVTYPGAVMNEEDGIILRLLPLFCLYVFEDLHLLDDLYELAVTRILAVARPVRARIVGLASSLNDPTDLAEWLGVDEVNRFSFYPSDRSSPVAVSVKSFTIAHSASLMKAMVKPAYEVLKASPGGVIVFVPSRITCKTIATDLVTQSGTEMDFNGFLGAPRADVEPLLERLRDPSLYEPLLRGIGYLIPTMSAADTSLVLELFASGIIRALIVPREAAWTLPLRSDVVLLLGAQYVRSNPNNLDRQVINYTRNELVKMQGFAISSASPQSGGGRMFVMCQAEQVASIQSTLNDGLPLESSLPDVFTHSSSNSKRAEAGLNRMLKDRPAPPRPQLHRPRQPDMRKRDLMDLVGWSFFGKRAKSNPTYYGIHRDAEAEGTSRILDKWFEGREWAEVPWVASEKKGKAKANGSVNGSMGGANGVSVGEGTVETAVEEVLPEPGVGEVDGETVEKSQKK